MLNSKSNKVFVFGSNLAGRHGKGAALFAKQNHGAVYGQGEGLQGNSYGIATKDARLRTRKLSDVAESVACFLVFATDNPGMQFEVTKIGCGLAGFKETDIAPLFCGAPDNCVLPEGWERGLPRGGYLMVGKYFVQFAGHRGGCCVYRRRVDPGAHEYHSGPYGAENFAQAEVDELNRLVEEDYQMFMADMQWVEVKDTEDK